MTSTYERAQDAYLRGRAECEAEIEQLCRALQRIADDIPPLAQIARDAIKRQEKKRTWDTMTQNDKLQAKNRKWWDESREIPELKGQFYSCTFDEHSQKIVAQPHDHLIVEARMIDGIVPQDIRWGIALMLEGRGLVFLGSKSTEHIIDKRRRKK